MTLSCALYARYSSDQQRAASIEDQFRVCRERAAREGWKIVGAYKVRLARKGHVGTEYSARAGLSTGLRISVMADSDSTKFRTGVSPPGYGGWLEHSFFVSESHETSEGLLRGPAITRLDAGRLW